MDVAIMKPVSLHSAANQVASHMRGEILRGAITGTLPGIHTLAKGLAVNHKTVKAAVGLLEREGILIPQGVGRARRIVLPTETGALTSLRVAILNHDPPHALERYAVEMLYALLDSGHRAFFSGKSLVEMRMNPERVMKHVADTAANAWVVVSGSHEILQRMITFETPVFSLSGRKDDLPIAWSGPLKSEATRQATRRLVELGHRRIVMIVRADRRLPTLGVSEQAFIDELQDHGIPTGPYHLPDWIETADGLHACLDSLFRSTPPTALILDEPACFFAVQQHLLSKGLRVPRDVSLVCRNAHPDFDWFQPKVAHIDWNYEVVLKALLRWASACTNSRTHHRETPTKAIFVDGGTIGPARRD